MEKMGEDLQSKLVSLLKQEKIQLWNPPFTKADSTEAATEHLEELAVRYSQELGFPQPDLVIALEDIRSQAIKRGNSNRTYKETNIATLELQLPKGVLKNKQRKQFIETKLDVTTQDLTDRIREEYDLTNVKLIFKGKTMLHDKRLDELHVKNNNKIMILKLGEPEQRNAMVNEEEKQRCQEEGLKRTQKGFQILSERDGSEDPATTPFLEIADQRGNPIHIPLAEKKALILAMGVHEKGRSLMKRKEYDPALCHLLQADEHFCKCGSALLNTVDNYAVLQLDIVWCYRALESLSCLDDAKQRLQKAENCFINCYGEQQQRLEKIKGNTGGEEVLFLRLHLLQSLLAYLDHENARANKKLKQAQDLYSHLHLDPEKMNQLMSMGFSEQDARLGLRACRGDIQMTALHITKRNEERDEIKRKEREKRRRRLEAINTLVELGYSKKAAAKALHQTNGDVDEAYRKLLESNEGHSSGTSQSDTDLETKVNQMAYLGFQREAVEEALRRVNGDVIQATQILLDNQGQLSPELQSPSSLSSSSEEPSTSDSTTSASSSLDADLVNEVLEDIPRHEEDYLDVTLEEESELMGVLKSYLEKSCTSST